MLFSLVYNGFFIIFFCCITYWQWRQQLSSSSFAAEWVHEQHLGGGQVLENGSLALLFPFSTWRLGTKILSNVDHRSLHCSVIFNRCLRHGWKGSWKKSMISCKIFFNLLTCILNVFSSQKKDNTYSSQRSDNSTEMSRYVSPSLLWLTMNFFMASM